MKSCTHCKKRIPYRRAKCMQCGRVFHDFCVAKFLSKSVLINNVTTCCYRNFSTTADGSTFETNNSGPIIPRVDEQIAARVNLLDAARGFDPERSYSSSLSSPRSIVNDLTMSVAPVDSHSMDIENDSELPTGWDDMQQSQRDGIMFKMLHEISQSQKSLAGRVSALEFKTTVHSSEMEQMKELRNRGMPLAEIKVNGIPFSCKDQIESISLKILQVLNLTNLSNDILSVRPIKVPKLTQPNNSSLPSSQATGNVTDSNANFPFVIKFKSCEIRQHVLQAKRAFGPLKLSHIIQTDNDADITLYEMLPRMVHELKMAARAKGKPLGYKYIWASNASVLAQKHERSPLIVITTEEDLNLLV